MRNQSRIGWYLMLAFAALASASLVRAQSYEFSNFYSFQNNGTGPTGPAALVIGSDGNLYGVSCCGGSLGFGTVFELTPAGTLTVLHNFTSADSHPSSLVRDNGQGNLYGTTNGDGTGGTVFELIKEDGEPTISRPCTATSGRSHRR